MAKKNSGRMPSSAVTTSISSTLCTELRLSSSAPAGGAAIMVRPWSIWLRPATRVSCSCGTISEVEACIAGSWKACMVARSSVIA